MNARPAPMDPWVAISRRALLTSTGRLALLALSGGLPALLSGCITSQGQQALASDRELARLVDAVIGVDMHSHSGGVHFRATPGVDLAKQMRRGGMTAVCLCHTGDGPVISRDADNRITFRSPGPGELWRHTQARLNFIDDMVRNQGLRRVLKLGDLEDAHRDRAPAIVQTIEGCQFLEGQLERIAEVHRRGVRQLQLVHFFRSELGDNQTEPAEQGGLTPLGRQVVAECNRLGIVIDTAHGTMQFVDQAAGVSRTPLLLSHTSVTRRPAPFSRLISREHAKLIAQTGGVVGVWGLAPTFESLPAFVDGIARAVDAIGVEHVGLGSDVGGRSRNVWPDYADFPLVVQLLQRKGFSAGEIGKLVGGNYVRVFNACAQTASSHRSRWGSA